MANSNTGETLRNAATPSNKAPKMNQKFEVGTRIENMFELDGEPQALGGNIKVFEKFKDEDGAEEWGYLIHDDDGDKEHLLEADAVQHLVVVESKKHPTKSQAEPKTVKRVKPVNVLEKDARSIAAEKKTPEPVRSQHRRSAQARGHRAEGKKN